MTTDGSRFGLSRLGWLVGEVAVERSREVDVCRPELKRPAARDVRAGKVAHSLVFTWRQNREIADLGLAATQTQQPARPTQQQGGTAPDAELEQAVYAVDFHCPHPSTAQPVNGALAPARTISVGRTGPLPARWVY